MDFLGRARLRKNHRNDEHSQTRLVSAERVAHRKNDWLCQAISA